MPLTSLLMEGLGLVIDFWRHDDIRRWCRCHKLTIEQGLISIVLIQVQRMKILLEVGVEAVGEMKTFVLV